MTSLSAQSIVKVSRQSVCHSGSRYSKGKGKCRGEKRKEGVGGWEEEREDGYIERAERERVGMDI